MQGFVTELDLMRLRAQGIRANGRGSHIDLREQINDLARIARFLLKCEHERQQREAQRGGRYGDNALHG